MTATVIHPVGEGRHLAAIMFMDMVGYSARMQDNEPRAIAAVRRLWDLVRPVLARHGGLEVDLAGDGMLTEFQGALAAVRCALEVHALLHEQNQALPTAERTVVRAGVHLGDIQHHDGRIYGDGVNIAARLLPLSPPGAVVMSVHVKDQLVNVLERTLILLGTRALKNIRAPMEIWCLPGPDCSNRDLEAARAAARVDAARRWTFGKAVLDGRTLELTVDGAAVSLDKKALDVLVHLLEHAGEVVTGEELVAAVWPGRASESTLPACIANLRGVLGEDAVRTVHGFGFRLATPVAVESLARDAPPAFEFKLGDRPAHRPLWTLVEHLGTGGHGEAWLARHDKTREVRVFKFALEAAALASLKREITLSRVLRDSLGARTDHVRILDWNLEEVPYFIESEYASQGNLAAWADRQGGLGKIPLATRLALAARIADALAAAHSVGVLHKDLKPSNVLVCGPGDAASTATGDPPIKLGDFGSGGVLDPERLEELGITRMGFTKTLLNTGATSGTPIYLAPEVIGGQPFTVQSDIYSLGVTLYQLAVGDFHRPLSPGWEHDVEDELLREDIAAAVAGNPARRLTDAALLAQRLRGLEQRRQERAAARADEERARQARLALERAQARRGWLRATVAVLLIGIGVSLALYFDARRARNEAQAAAATAKAVSDFLNVDLFSHANPYEGPGQAMTVRTLLDQAAATVDQRFADKPEAAAKVHYSLGMSYMRLALATQAREQLTLAAAQFEKLYGRASDEWLDARRQLAFPVMTPPEEGVTMQREVLQIWQSRLDRGDPRVLNTRRKLAMLLMLTERNAEAATDAKEVLGYCKDGFPTDNGFDICGAAYYVLGKAQIGLGDLSAAETTLRTCRDKHYEKITEGNEVCQFALGALETQLGRYREGEKLMETYSASARRWGWANFLYPPQWPLYYSARSLIEQHRPQDAIALLKQWPPALSQADPEDWSNSRQRYLMGLAEQQLGKLPEAEAQLRQSIAAFEQAEGKERPELIQRRSALADVLREEGRIEDAQAVLGQIPAGVVSALPPQHPLQAELRREQGLLWQRQKKFDAARAALSEALKIYEFRFGEAHWRTLRAREELAKVPTA